MTHPRTTYPHVGHAGKFKRSPGPCQACDRQATHRVEVRVSWFRGEDEYYRACQLCANGARLDCPKFLQAVKAKEGTHAR